MKNHFREYFALSDKERNEIWKNGVLVMDANVLLNLCRYSKRSSKDLLAIIHTFKDRIWLPYQVAWEFFENRLSVIAGTNAGFDSLISKIDGIGGVLDSALELNKYKSDTAIDTKTLRNEFQTFGKRLKNIVEKWKKDYTDNDKDAILDELLKLFDGKVGEDYSQEQLSQIYKEGESRYKESIPPGYEDLSRKKDKGVRHIYGDLIWWKQAMDYSKENGRNLIIVTGDEKDDWWYIVAGKTIGPRVELISEFRDKTDGRLFLMYKTHQFMEQAKIVDGAKVSDSSIKEAKETGSMESLFTIHNSPIDTDLTKGYAYLNSFTPISSRFTNGISQLGGSLASLQDSYPVSSLSTLRNKVLELEENDKVINRVSLGGDFFAHSFPDASLYTRCNSISGKRLDDSNDGEKKEDVIDKKNK